MVSILRKIRHGAWLVVLLGAAASARAQGGSPETGNTIFPGGGMFSYNSVIIQRKALGPGTPSPTLRPTFQHSAPFTLVWGMRRDWQLNLVVPLVTTRRDALAAASPGGTGGTGLGDVLVTVKHRFLRLDSERGTTQASFLVGPKLPSGRTNLRDSSGTLLPVPQQPGSGSTDVFLGATFTYTGLFGIRKLVADESFSYMVRTEGSQQMRLGDTIDSRFWLSYRPYQSKTVGPEFWIGPALTWQRSLRDHLAGVAQADSGGDVLGLGVTTYYSPAAAWNLWFAVEFPVYQESRGQAEFLRRFSFGVARQFRIR